jgi:hypothetical protein
MTTEPNNSAFPYVLEDEPAPGLTKREYFAAMALQGILAADLDHLDIDDKCIMAVNYANQLIRTLNNPSYL